jgi:hypothetical protein
MSQFLKAIALVACMSTGAFGAEEEAIPRSGDISAISIRFLPRRPAPDDALMQSIYDISKDHLSRNLELLKRYPVLKVELIGTADEAECSGRECVELSERRVRLVRDWLLSNGIPAESIVKTEARALDLPLADGSTEEGRLLNRRVEFNLAL